MGSAHADLYQLLKDRAELELKIHEASLRSCLPGLTPAQSIVLSTIFGFMESTGNPPMASDVMPTISPGSKTRSLFYYLPTLKKAGLISIKKTGISPGLIYPTEKACRLVGVPFSHVPHPLNPTYQRALVFIREYVEKHGEFPSHHEINVHLGRKYKSAGDVLNRLLRNNFITNTNGKWFLVDNSS